MITGTVVPAGKVLTNYDNAAKATGDGAAGQMAGVTVDPAVFGNGGVGGPTKSNVSSGVFGNGFVEAPVFFLRKGVYYALFGNCCCFCGHGSGIGVYTAPHPLGPWTYHDNVGCTKPTTPGCGCGMNHPGCSNIYGNSVTKAQQNFVIQIPTQNGTQCRPPPTPPPPPLSSAATSTAATTSNSSPPASSRAQICLDFQKSVTSPAERWVR